MTEEQRLFVSDFLADLSKGLLLAVAIGTGTGKMDYVFATGYVLVAAEAFHFAYKMRNPK